MALDFRDRREHDRLHPAANISTQNSSIGATNTSELAGGAIGGTEGDAERAAEKLYEERMEEEYAKREGGA
ncbi:unnamed protein product [Aureobasidium pullulans]|nr:unnamed protein product [Aureobasidium pullulans]CAD0053260.1 unnamed protein product [Aureobasidium pullulans]